VLRVEDCQDIAQDYAKSSEDHSVGHRLSVHITGEEDVGDELHALKRGKEGLGREAKGSEGGEAADSEDGCADKPPVPLKLVIIIFCIVVVVVVVVFATVVFATVAAAIAIIHITIVAILIVNVFTNGHPLGCQLNIYFTFAF